MKTYSFHEGLIDTRAKYIFNSPKHRALQSNERWKCLYARDEKESLVAFLWVNIVGEVAHAPARAPFGSIEVDAHLEPKGLYDFITYVVETLNVLGVKKLVLKNPPALYNTPYSALLITFLLNQGFSIEQAEVSSIIPVSPAPYANLVAEWELRKLKQAKTNSLFFQQKEGSHLQSIYSFIKSCRKDKGYTLSMSLADLTALYTAFPEQLLLFAVSQESALAAACIAIQVSDDVLYTFYYDHAKTYDAFSPVVMLMEGIYHFCQAKQIHLLDLGTAALDRQPNFPLLAFKAHVGGIPSSKLTFVKELP